MPKPEIQTKCVWMFHDKKEEFTEVLKESRFMINEIIRVGDEKNLTSRKELHREMYENLRTEIYSKYVHGAMGRAKQLLKLHRTTRKKKPNSKLPYVWSEFAQLDNQAYKIDGNKIRIPIKPYQYVRIDLPPYVMEKLQGMKLGSIIITPIKLIISYSKEIEELVPDACVGIDMNLDNITATDTKGVCTIYDLTKVNKIKTNARNKRARFKRNDVRIRKKLSSKSGRKEKARVNDILNKVSKLVVISKQAIYLENLKGIRKLYRKGNGQGKKYRGRMNTWSRYELQRQIQYKARWQGIPVNYVKANGTSSKCAECGKKCSTEEHRKVICPDCKIHIDRDVNASKNILARGMRVMPIGVTGEAMVAEPIKVICKVDVTKCKKSNCKG